MSLTNEHIRLQEDKKRSKHWRLWGPYLSERQWGTVREDYSADGEAWEYFTHEDAISRAYRWGEDGIAGISDEKQRLCLALAVWNEKDPILKERLFGLTSKEGNHAEDVKEYYFYLDSTPSHSYMKYLYKYPQQEFPYEQLRRDSQQLSRTEPENDLLATGVFDQSRYYDIQVEYAKKDVDDLVMQITVTNQADEPATLHVLPHVWFRNTWSWDHSSKPQLKLNSTNPQQIDIYHDTLGKMVCTADGADDILFTENETNHKRLFKSKNASPYVKDAFHRYVVDGETTAVNSKKTGTKAAFQYILKLTPKEQRVITLRLSKADGHSDGDRDDLTAMVNNARLEADEFYQAITPFDISEDERRIQRQAFAGLLWTKQFYHLNVYRWMKGDFLVTPDDERVQRNRNHDWDHMYAEEILSMPDKWEYPWFAAWDTAFHAIPLAMIDPEFAKEQLDVLTREWYMHPNGQIPAYEWNFSDVNPPVHAWATLRVYQIERKRTGKTDRLFLERVFQKLLLNFTWWVNQKDQEGNNVFQGGFLGLDNIGAFNRSTDRPGGGQLEQADGTSWMGMYALNMLAIALELALENPAYEDIASKFFEHFMYIADAMNKDHGGYKLWDEADGFYYDVLNFPDGHAEKMKIRSMVGLVPLFAVYILEAKTLDALPGFRDRMDWFLKQRPDLKKNIASMEIPGVQERRLLSIVNKDQLERILSRVLNEEEFLSPYGIRALSKVHKDQPYRYILNDKEFSVAYEPAESSSPLFGGNSNWRGPIWFPVNYLLIEALQKFDYYYREEFQIEYPVGSGQLESLWNVSKSISERLQHIFIQDSNGQRAVNGASVLFDSDQAWGKNILFYEYFHGDNGSGLGASHQTGWTALVAKLIHQTAEYKVQGPGWAYK